MKITRYLALLRGINVGGSNIIRMAALRACFEDMGFAGVVTYIQSGNVIFSASSADPTVLGHTIEAALSGRFRYTSMVVVVSHDMLKRIVKEAPEGFGARPDRCRYDVIFLRQPLTARER